MKALAAVICFVVLASQAEAFTQCKINSDCGPASCCKLGFCIDYETEGGACLLNKLTCGCAPGLECKLDGWWRCKKTAPPTPGSCGKPQVQMSRVIAGDDAKKGAWPWQILMLMNGRPGCGGSIINSKWIVTAAHCVDGRTNQPSTFKVRVGEHDRTKNEGTEVEHEVERVMMHEQYDRRRLNKDIALFKLKKPIMFNKYVQPVCLPAADVQPGHECYITGWGKIVHPGNMHTHLQQARMPVVSNQVCNAKNLASIGIPVTDAMICGGEGGKTRISGCHGDSGGPFVCKVNGRWELHGDVSHGSSRCDSKASYTVFARTTYFKSWIEQKIATYGM